MDPSTEKATTSASGKSFDPGLWGSWIPVGLVWSALFLQVSWEWGVIPQYNYGYAVPFLAAYLGWKRWETAPVLIDSEKSRSGLIRLVFLISVILLLTFFAGARLIQEANRDWRLLYWIQGSIAVGLTWLLVGFQGGWRWMKHFSFPILFALVAIPWPTLAEELWIQGLRDSVTHFAVEALNWTGAPAVQRGTVIELGNGLVGVDEACSGIQSFQASLMVSLFLGELFELKWLWRTPLIVFSLFWAYLLNVIRAYALARIARALGTGAVEEWHDFTGLVLMGICFGGIVVVSLLLDKFNPVSPRKITVKKDALRIAPWISAAAALWVIGSVIGVEAWYRVQEGKTSLENKTVQWEVAWPESNEERQVVEEDFADSVRTILRYNEGQKVFWKEADQTSWLAFYFEWERGNAAVMNTQFHTPQGCLTFSGVEVEATHPGFEVEINEAEFPVSAFTAKDDRHRFHVFYLLWRDPAPNMETLAKLENEERDWSATRRIRNALHGRRYYAQKALQISVFDAPDYEYARRKYEDHLQQLIEIRR